MNSSALLLRFARRAFSARIRTLTGPTLFGPGGGCVEDWRLLATLCSPFDSGRVALALTTGVTGCGCSATLPTPTASQTPCKDVARLLERRARYREKYGNNGFGLTLAQHLAVQAGLNDGTTVYPHPEYVEAVMRFPTSWTELPPSETPSTPSAPSGSAD